MNAAEFYKQYGRKECERVAKAAGIKYSYFTHLVYKTRRASPETAQKLATASDGRMSAWDLMTEQVPKQKFYGPRAVKTGS